MSKKQFGQFFTKNSDYILSGLEKFIIGKNIIDPFAGGGDLIAWAEKNKACSIIGYDIDYKYVNNKRGIYFNDSINNSQKYDFILTNPPYLNINKADKRIKEKYFSGFEFEDLYQISLQSIFNSQEGIVIVPINFLSATNSKKIRNLFFSRFEIIEMNYFKQQVFSDTTYNVIAFYYKKKLDILKDRFTIKCHIYPENKIFNITLKKDFSWTIGGDFMNIIKKQKNFLGIYRFTEDDVRCGGIEINAAFNHVKKRKKIKISKNIHQLIKNNIILLKAIDSGTERGKIALENIKKYNVDCLVSKPSSRHMIYLVFKEPLPVAEQKKIIQLFNNEINQLRDKYCSLFLSNYRDNDRKRISFNFVYKFINYLYYNEINRCFNKQGQLL